MPRRYVFLVPGFFGFTSLGALSYFFRVRETLASALRRHGVEAEIVECPTQPTGSIRHRAERLLDTVVRHGADTADELHFVGHSTGGLDIRLLVTPGVRLRADGVEAAIGARTRSVITLATPHFGTPLATFFTTFQGRRVLQLLSLLAANQPGRAAVFATSQLVSLLARLDRAVSFKESHLHALSNRLLGRITLEHDDPIFAFMREVASDQGAIVQLTPEAMNLYNAAVSDRDGVSYRCLLTAAPPQARHRLAEFRSPARAAMATLFSMLYAITAREHGQYPYPSPAPALAERVGTHYPFAVEPSTNDGISPTLSQLYGELLDAVVGDHLDIVGQFRGAGGDPLADWLPSGSAFDEDRFLRVWDGVASAIAATSAAPGA